MILSVFQILFHFRYFVKLILFMANHNYLLYSIHFLIPSFKTDFPQMMFIIFLFNFQSFLNFYSLKTLANAFLHGLIQTILIHQGLFYISLVFDLQFIFSSFEHK